MKIVKYITAICAIAAFTSSCGKWLDVQTKSQVTAENVFSNADGYRAALTGVYINIADEKLYGGYFSLTRLEFLAQTMRLNGPSTGRPDGFIDELFMYRTLLTNRNSMVEEIFNSIWSKAYNAVANCNYFIKKLEAQDAGMFESGVKDVMLGEAYALRAYIHFDMMRLFNYPYLSESGKTMKRVPYVNQYALELTPSSTSDEIMNQALADLAKAESLLVNNDPAVTGRPFIDPFVTNNRAVRMNYFAVRALKARIELYRGNHDAAYDEAKYVIDNVSKMSVRMANEDDMITKDGTFAVNRSCPMENIFGVSNPKLGELVNAQYPTSTSQFNRVLVKNNAHLTHYVHANDIRRKYWLDVFSATRIHYIKYTTSNTQSVINLYPKPVVSLIHIGEIYLIATEAAAKSATRGGIDNALTIYNEFRTKRGIPTFINNSAEALDQELEIEYFRELLGEGQLFYYYKRINKAVLPHVWAAGTYPVTVTMTPETYTPDLPQSEVSGGRQL